MQIDMPTLPPLCVEVGRLQHAYMGFRGKPDAVRAALAEIRASQPSVEIAVDGSVASPTGFLIVMVGNTPYKAIGGMIFIARHYRLKASGWYSYPPLCKSPIAER